MEYVTFVENLAALPVGKEGNLHIKSLEPGKYKYEARYVKASVSPAGKSPAGGDTLEVRFYNGELHPEPYTIKIISELSIT